MASSSSASAGASGRSLPQTRKRDAGQGTPPPAKRRRSHSTASSNSMLMQLIEHADHAYRYAPTLSQPSAASGSTGRAAAAVQQDEASGAQEPQGAQEPKARQNAGRGLKEPVARPNEQQELHRSQPISYLQRLRIWWNGSPKPRESSKPESAPPLPPVPPFQHLTLLRCGGSEDMARIPSLIAASESNLSNHFTLLHTALWNQSAKMTALETQVENMAAVQEAILGAASEARAQSETTEVAVRAMLRSAIGEDGHWEEEEEDEDLRRYKQAMADQLNAKDRELRAKQEELETAKEELGRFRARSS